jgi:hypothetical protein
MTSCWLKMMKLQRAYWHGASPAALSPCLGLAAMRSRSARPTSPCLRVLQLQAARGTGQQRVLVLPLLLLVLVRALGQAGGS